MNELYCLRTPSRSDGFILPATLFILAAILIAATWYALWVSRMIDTAGLQVKSERFSLDSQSTFALLMHHIALGESTPRGIKGEGLPGKGLVDTRDDLSAPQPEIRFDDRCYQGIGETRFSIQDENGLIGVNFFSQEQLRSLLSLMGVSVEKQGPLIDRLLDYLDTDNLVRLNGAEEREYQTAGRVAPPNALLLNSAELYNALDWDQFPLLWNDSAFRRLITVATLGIPNLNTAPPLALMTIPTVNRALAAALIEKREQRGYESLSDIEAALGQSLGLDPLGMGFYPGKYLRISIWHPELPMMREIHIQLTPVSERQQPWLVDYETSAPRISTENEEHCESLEEFIPRSAVSSD